MPRSTSSSRSRTTRPTGRCSSTARRRSRRRVLDDPPRRARWPHRRCRARGGRKVGLDQRAAPRRVRAPYIAAHPRKKPPCRTRVKQVGVARRSWLCHAVTVVGCDGRAPAATPCRRSRRSAEPCVGIPDPTARCHRLRVSENQTTRRRPHHRPSHRRAPGDRAADQAKDAVVYLAGGPGQAATELMGDALRQRRRAAPPRSSSTPTSAAPAVRNGLLCRFYGPPSTRRATSTGFLPIEKVRACRQRPRARSRPGAIHDERVGRGPGSDTRRARLRAADPASAAHTGPGWRWSTCGATRRGSARSCSTDR